MKLSIVPLTLTICVLITFLIPLIQLSIGFRYVVKDGEDPNKVCAIAPDLPLLLAIGGIFALFCLGTSYSFLRMITSNNNQSELAGHTPRLLIGLVSLIFGSVTLIFFILIQMRVYRAYSNNVQFNVSSQATYCHSTVMQGALAMIILTYIGIILFVTVFIVLLIRQRSKSVSNSTTPSRPNTRL